MNVLPIPEDAIEVEDTGKLMAELVDLKRGAAREGNAANLYLSGTDYDEFAIMDYYGAGLNELTLYARTDGKTAIRYTGEGMRDAASAVVRIGSSLNQPCRNIRFRNKFKVDGLSTDDNVGAIWGMAVGGSYDDDPRRADLENVDIQGPEVCNVQQSGIKLDGNGGTRRLKLSNFEIHHTGTRHDPGESDGFGEALYVGDGNTGRPVTTALISNGWIHDVNFGEGIEVKQNCNDVVIDNILLEDILIDNGAAIKITSRLASNIVRRCVVDRVRVSGDSDTRFPVGIQSYGGTLIEGNHVQGVDGGYCYSTINSRSQATMPVAFKDNYANAARAMSALQQHGTFFGPHPVGILDMGGNFASGEPGVGNWAQSPIRPRPEILTELSPIVIPDAPAPPVVVPAPPGAFNEELFMAYVREVGIREALDLVLDAFS